MLLSTIEVKNLLKDVFRLVVALNKDDRSQALSAFSSILDTAMDDNYADMPPLESAPLAPTRALFRPVHADMPSLETLFRPTAERPTTERPTAERPVAAEHAPLHTSSTTEDEVHLVISEQPEDELSVIEPPADDEGVEAVELDDEGNEVGLPQEEAEEEAEEEEPADEEEEVELDLEPVRIRKVIYWKDKESGDLYQYLPDDEVGDKVGSYVNGVPVFE